MNDQEIIRDLTAEVIEAHRGEIGTHYEGCWHNHAACLAVIIHELVQETVDGRPDRTSSREG